jgi:hypothetical protein
MTVRYYQIFVYIISNTVSIELSQKYRYSLFYLRAVLYEDLSMSIKNHYNLFISDFIVSWGQSSLRIHLYGGILMNNGNSVKYSLSESTLRYCLHEYAIQRNVKL